MSLAYFVDAAQIEAEQTRARLAEVDFDLTRVLSLRERELPDPSPRQVRVRILAISIEHNSVHAALADTINIAQLRGGSICPGNAFTGEVLEVGAAVGRFRPGDIVIFGGTETVDRFGFPLRIPGYDQPRSHGCFAEETLVHESELKPAPLDCGLDLWHLTAALLRASTAFHLWRRGRGIFRVKIPEEKLARLNVLAFGGGTSEFFLMLARSEGHRAFYCAANPRRLRRLEELGIETIDQSRFGRFVGEENVRDFARAVKRLTRGEGMHVVCDMFRGPVFDAGLAALARGGVNVSAGWQLATEVHYNSAFLSIQQATIDHVHGDTVDGSQAALDLVGRVFLPDLHDELYAFEDLPRALDELHRNVQTGLPVVRVARDLPTAVSELAAS